MIELLASLRLADEGQEVPPGYAMKGYGFVLELAADGSDSALTGVHAEEAKGGLKCIPSAIPTMTRANNPPPILACDGWPYVLGPVSFDMGGWFADDSPAAQKVRRETPGKHQAFRTQLASYGSTSGDPACRAYEQWCQLGQPGLIAGLQGLSDAARKRLAVGDPVAIQVRGATDGPIHSHEPAVQFWGDKVTQLKSSSGKRGICLACGQTRPLLDTLPQSLLGRHVPGTDTAQVALMSANFQAVGRTHSGSASPTAALCADCGSRAVTNFNRLAADPAHCFRDPGDSEATLWFSTGDDNADVEVGALVDPSPDIVARLLRAPRDADLAAASGYLQATLNTITFSGNIARLVPRSITRTPISEVRASVRAWFRDSATLRGGEEGWFRLTSLAAATGDLKRGTGGKWEQATPHGSVMALFSCAIHNRPIPHGLVAHALQRARAEAHLASMADPIVVGRGHARLALMRLHLNRTTWKDEPVTTELDESRSDPAYLAGRLFSLRASLQETAHYYSSTRPGAEPRADSAPNATIVDKHFSRAMQSPKSVEPGLAVLSQRHLGMLRRSEAGRGAGFAYQRAIEGLGDRLGDRLPPRLTIDEQAAWLAGFYQQQVASRAAAIDGAAKKRADQAATTTEGNLA